MKTINKPSWIRYRIPGGEGYLRVKKTISDLYLHTICTEAGCPNAGECFATGTATFLILGDTCTRDCRYCSVKKGIPQLPDPGEPARIAEAVMRLGLKYAVITSVTRDDISDGGSSFFAETCSRIRKTTPGCGVELLVPDFKNSMERSLDLIRMSGPSVLNHNIETVKDYFPLLRPSGDYGHSLSLLKRAADCGFTVKSGLMIGFGESLEQIKTTMNDLINTGCSILTVGQYLKSDKNNYEVVKYYHPDEFEEIRLMAESTGFSSVMSAPNVRSSYHAREQYAAGD